MSFQFTRQRLTGTDLLIERVCEILPGATSWTVLIGMLGLAWWQPVVAAILIIAFDLQWLLRLFYMTILLVLSSARLAVERETDWMARLHELDSAPVAPPSRCDTPSSQDRDSLRSLRSLRSPARFVPARSRDVVRRLSAWIYRRALRHAGTRPRAGSVSHLVIIPVAKEPRPVIEPGIVSLARQQFPARQILVVLAVEERAPEAVKQGAEAMRRAYRDQFLDFLVVRHPDGVPGEARVKGANITHAAKAAAAYLEALNIPFEQVVVSCFDADTVVSPSYFACLTYTFLISPDRTRASFQPIPVYHNNIWDVPGFARLMDIGSSFFQLVEATNPATLVTFSSHSMSFKALVDVGYWPVDLVSDDSAIFWKSLIHFHGCYRVIPMYVTLSMDVVHAGTWWKTAVHVYKQKRRWAWGVENFPIVVRGFLATREIPWSVKLMHLAKLFESHIAWATWPFLLTVLGWLPAIFADQQFSSSVLYYSAPRIAGVIFSLASVSLAASIILSFCLLPRSPTPHPLLKRLQHIGEWLLVPVVGIVLSAIPALDAQTRLLAGKYMEFWVTDKTRSSKAHERARVVGRPVAVAGRAGLGDG